MSLRACAAAVSSVILGGLVLAQAPGSRGAIPNITPAQTAALAEMNSGLAPLTQTLAAARTAVVAASLADPRNEADVRAKVDAVKAAELAKASARAEAFAKIQASGNKRGPTALHILNGQLMAAFVDDDPDSSNNWSGYFGIEIEATTKVSVRNIWLKKIN